MFPVSIAENIGYSLDLQPNINSIIEAAKITNAHSFIEKLPNGYDTILNENGNDLSGGQRQLIGLSRAFLKRSPVVLLDEPTASQDALTERQIQIAVKKHERAKNNDSHCTPA